MAEERATVLNSAEENWLLASRHYTEHALLLESELSQSVQSCETLQAAVIQSIKNVLHSNTGSTEPERAHLPLSYSFLTLADLRSQQSTPVCSHLNWSTSRYEQWAHEGRKAVPGQKELPRAHLILMGYLTNEGQVQPGCKSAFDGSLYVRDRTGVVACEMLEFSLERLGHLFLFTNWAYIPSQYTHARPGGYLEIYAAPVHVIPPTLPVTLQLEGKVLGEPETTTAISVQSATRLLQNRSLSGKTLFTLVGELCRVSSILKIRDRAMFFLFLKDFSSDVSLPVLVQSPEKLCWFHALRSGNHYVLTNIQALRLKLSRCRVFTVSSASQLQPYDKNRVSVHEPNISLGSGARPACEVHLPPSVEASTPQSSMQDSSSLELLADEPASSIKTSKMLTFKGTITKVLNGPAGLYELDGSICLCVAHQPILQNGRALRPGAVVELEDVHLQQKPSSHYPLIVLCCCLRSVIRVSDFSRLCTTYQPFNAATNIYSQLLMMYHLDLPGYLWMVSAIESLLQKLCPNLMDQHDLLAYSDVPGMVERCLEPYLALLPATNDGHRDIMQELVDEEHHCPLVEYQSLKSPCHIPSISELLSMAKRRSWELLPVSKIIPHAEACYMTSPELNRALAWSFHRLLADDFNTKPVVIGVLRASSRSGFLLLQDETGCLPCKILRRTEDEESQFWATDNLGYILQVENYQLVVERLVQSNFPSWEQLRNKEYIKETNCRVYIQFFIDDAETLDEPSTSSQKETTYPIPVESGEPSRSSKNEGDMNPVREPQKVDQDADSSMGPPKAKSARIQEKGHITRSIIPGHVSGQQCVTRLFIVLHKEGLLLRNCPLSQRSNVPRGQNQGGCAKAELQLSFYALSAWIGEPCLWSHLDSVKGIPEIEAAEQDWDENTPFQKVKLLFLGKAIRWSDVLHAGGIYRIVVPQETDVGVLECSNNSCIPLSTQHQLRSICPPSLRVQDRWRLQYVASLSDVTNQQKVHAALASMRARCSPIAKILSSSATDTLVSFCCEVLGRSVCESDRNSRSIATQRTRRSHDVFLPWDLSIKVTVKDPSDASCSMDVYMDLALAPYPLGLLPGAKVYFENLQMVISRAKKVYCKYLVCSSFTLLSFMPDEQQRLLLPHPEISPISSIPLVLFIKLMSKSETPHKGRSTCRVTSVISLSLRWVCAICTAIFKQGRCTQNLPPCPSRSGVFQAKAKIVVEDGSSEALVLCRNQLVMSLLRLSSSQWDGVQQHVLGLGEAYVQQWGRSAELRDEELTEDFFTHVLKMLCNSNNVCRPILLTFEPERRAAQSGQSDSRQMRRFTHRDQEYVTTLHPQLSLICLDLQEVDYRALSHVCSDRIEQNRL
ncbi:CST complex subunit CTC1 [Lissotriton helveticus]